MHRFLFSLLILLVLPMQASAQLLHHALEVRLEPATQSLAVEDQITLPEPVAGEIVFYLHSGLEPRASINGDALPVEKLEDGSYYSRYRLTLPAASRKFRLGYAGRLHHTLESSAVEQSRGFSDSRGLIDERGSVLYGASLWYPQFERFGAHSFELGVRLPAGWRSVSQGQRVERAETADGVNERWIEKTPQQEIYLIAAPFYEYSRSSRTSAREIELQAFLRSPDPRLANKYLDVTGRYIDMYEKLIGPYPYKKFALVENFWQTGFGMPSFTLLGSRVIRLPFILHTSYPHEILHNWWGNGVYVDFATGNWSEGLTAYLADHLIKQQQGQAVRHRQQSLQKYRDYAATGRDFALTEFRGRHSPATEAVGYGKTMMLFHMLRNRIGDQAFIAGLQRFYREYRFRDAGFKDLERIFTETSGQNLEDFFSQWVNRVGAPEIGLASTEVTASGASFRLELILEQRQSESAYRLRVPVAISLDGVALAEKRVLDMRAKRQKFELEFEQKPLRVDIDPAFDLFRKLDPAETPTAFTGLFGARELTVVLPRAAAADLQAAWPQFARGLANTGPATDIVWDDELEQLPSTRAVAVLGWNNRFAEDMRARIQRQGVQFNQESVKTESGQTPKRDHAFAWVDADLADDPEAAAPRAWITADTAAALPGLMRKLPHYHRYSYLAFAGTEPQNTLKGRWIVKDSPLSANLTPGSQRAQLSTQNPLIE